MELKSGAKKKKTKSSLEENRFWSYLTHYYTVQLFLSKTVNSCEQQVTATYKFT
jgi:hypothetical protein